MDTRDLPFELQVLASDQQEMLPERVKDYHRSGKVSGGSGGGRFGGRRAAAMSHTRDDGIDTIIQVPMVDERRLVGNRDHLANDDSHLSISRLFILTN
jgi:hypothetical protein